MTDGKLESIMPGLAEIERMRSENAQLKQDIYIWEQSDIAATALAPTMAEMEVKIKNQAIELNRLVPLLKEKARQCADSGHKIAELRSTIEQQAAELAQWRDVTKCANPDEAFVKGIPKVTHSDAAWKSRVERLSRELEQANKRIRELECSPRK